MRFKGIPDPQPDPTARPDPVVPDVERLRAALHEIRCKAEIALHQLHRDASTVETRAAKWRCSACGHTKHFTRPVPASSVVSCPKCQGRAFEAVPV